MISDDVLDEIFPIESIYVFTYNFEKDLNSQIKEKCKILNNMIGSWEYFGCFTFGICFIRKS